MNYCSCRISIVYCICSVNVCKVVRPYFKYCHARLLKCPVCSTTGGHCGHSWALWARVYIVVTGGHCDHSCRWELWAQVGNVGTYGLCGCSLSWALWAHVYIVVTGGHCGHSWALWAKVCIVSTGGHCGNRWALWAQVGIVVTVGHCGHSWALWAPKLGMYKNLHCRFPLKKVIGAAPVLLKKT